MNWSTSNGIRLKTLLFSVVLCAASLGLTGTSNAAVSGECYDCHTMHNSQNGLTMILTEDRVPVVGGATSDCLGCHSDPREEALRVDCLGCHSQNPGAGASNIVNPNNIPQVAHNNATDLAGGNYRHVFSDDASGHNVHGFGSNISTDGDNGNTPPGYLSAYNPAAVDYDTTYPVAVPQLLCAGQQGCHGDRDILSQTAAMKNTHHANDKALRYGADFAMGSQGSTVGTSYRFLKGVKGAEDNNWEATTSSTDHNTYIGEPWSDRSGGQNWAAIDTISRLCAECHGTFHITGATGIGGGGSGASPWLRHPTDIVIPNTSEYASFTTYSVVTPVGRQTIADAAAAGSGTVTPGTDIVICLSCHRAHASPYMDALRFSYSLMEVGTAGAGQGTGCFQCHTQKDG